MAQTAHFTCQQQNCIGITRGAQKDLAPCTRGGFSETLAAVSVRSSWMPVFSWIVTQKRVYESRISCRSWIASGVGWHSVCGGASHGDVGPLERRLALLLTYFPIAQSPRLYIRRLFRVVVVSRSENPLTSISYSRNPPLILWTLVALSFVYKDMSILVFSHIKPY